jgi:hypothetical protein
MPRTIALLVAALAATFVLGNSKRAECDGCIATFCGYSSECPGDCVCVIPQGQATGYCAGTR